MGRAALVLFLLIISYFIFLIRQDIIDNLDLKGEEQRAVSGIEQEVKLERELKERSKKLDTDKQIEALARTRLGLIKKGEKAYKVIIE
jgi:cell division protein FtsB